MKKYTTPDFEIEIQQVVDVVMASLETYESDPFDAFGDPFNRPTV
jgi:hypothetical protein